jgi:hypothetical protein
MKKKTTQQSPSEDDRLSIEEDFLALRKKHSPDGGSAFMIIETTFIDENGKRRWTFSHSGDPAALELMAAHMMHLMSSLRERRLAEVLRGGR